MKRDNNLVFLLLSFCICGFLHVFLYDLDYTDCLVQILYGSVLLIWTLSIRKRIIEKPIRRLLLGISAMLMLYFTLQVCRYVLFPQQVGLLRYLWYSYYLPMIVVPLLFLFLSFNIYRNNKVQSRLARYTLIGAAICLILLFYTNDLHMLVFRFSNPGPAVRGNSGTYQYGPLYLVFCVWLAALVASAVIILLLKCRNSEIHARIWLPLTILSVGMIGLVLGLFNAAPRFSGIVVWQLVEIFAFMIVCFIEACIQIGLIPANTGYEELFEKTKLPVRITDLTGSRTILSGAAFENGENTQIYQMPIRGGNVSWEVDMTEINELNRRLTETTNQIQSRNEYLKTENTLKEEQTKVDARTGLYDHIAAVISPQLNQICSLLDRIDEEDPVRTLSDVTVLNAYIKRRSNMELLGDDQGELPLTELITALKESAQYMCLYGTNVVISGAANDSFPAPMIILAYDFFEYFMEANKDFIEEAIVILSAKENSLSLRILSHASECILDENWEKERLLPYHGRITGSGQENDRIVRLVLTEGRAAL